MKVFSPRFSTIVRRQNLGKKDFPEAHGILPKICNFYPGSLLWATGGFGSSPRSSRKHTIIFGTPFPIGTLSKYLMLLSISYSICFYQEKTHLQHKIRFLAARLAPLVSNIASRNIRMIIRVIVFEWHKKYRNFFDVNLTCILLLFRNSILSRLVYKT